MMPDGRQVHALVTGANGFIGSHLVDALAARGFHVRCFVRPTGNLRWLRDRELEILTGTLDDQDALQAACRGVDYVFHVAGALTAVRAANYYTVNTEGTRAVATAARAASPALVRFLFVSSLAAAGPSHANEQPRVEADPCRPVSDYGRSKLLAEQCLRDEFAGLPVTVIRPPAVYGPRDAATLAFPKLVQHGIAPVFGWRPRKLSLVYVSDLVDGMIAAAESPLARGHTYFLAHPRAVLWQELYAAVGRAVKRRYLCLRLPLALGYAAALAADAGSRISGTASHLSYQKMREIAQPGWVCASTAAQRDFGFTCHCDLDAGLQRAVEWYRDHGWL